MKKWAPGRDPIPAPDEIAYRTLASVPAKWIAVTKYMRSGFWREGQDCLCDLLPSCNLFDSPCQLEQLRTESQIGLPRDTQIDVEAVAPADMH